MGIMDLKITSTRDGITGLQMGYQGLVELETKDIWKGKGHLVIQGLRRGKGLTHMEHIHGRSPLKDYDPKVKGSPIEQHNTSRRILELPVRRIFPQRQN